MSTWSNRVLGTAIWVAVVAAGALLVWLVISRAGAGLASGSALVTSPSSSPASASDGVPSGATTPERRGAWQGDVGVVTAVCRGAEVALVGAQPEEGVVVHVLDRGPTQLTVVFRGEDESPVTVTARCRSGRPDLSASSAPPAGPTPEAPAGSDGNGSEEDHPADD